MQAASTGAMTRRAGFFEGLVAIFQSVAARVSWVSGWGERLSKGRTLWAGRRRTDSRAAEAGWPQTPRSAGRGAAFGGSTSVRGGLPATQQKRAVLSDRYEHGCALVEVGGGGICGGGDRIWGFGRHAGAGGVESPG